MYSGYSGGVMDAVEKGPRQSGIWSLPDTLHDEFALVFIPEAFPVSVISCIQINVVFQYVQTGCCKQNLFVLHLCSEGWCMACCPLVACDCSVRLGSSLSDEMKQKEEMCVCVPTPVPCWCGKKTSGFTCYVELFFVFFFFTCHF